MPRLLHHSVKKNGWVHEVQILGSVPRNKERPISGPLVEKRVHCPVPRFEDQAKKLDFVHQTVFLLGVM